MFSDLCDAQLIQNHINLLVKQSDLIRSVYGCL